MARSVLLALLLALCAQSAAAVTLNFRTMGTSGWSPTVTAPGVTLEGGQEVAGQVQASGTNVAHERFRGVGAISGEDTGQSNGSDQIDSYGSNDVVIFRFENPVRLDSLSFIMADWWDRFDLYLGEDLTFQRTYKVDDLNGHGWDSTVHLGGDMVARTFAIGASEYQSCGYDIDRGHACWTENSAFRLASLSYSQVDLNPIPLPPTLLMLLASLSVLVFGRLFAIQEH